MAIFKTKAVVLKTQNYKESDKLVWMFSEKIGKISCIAKGAQRNKSRYLSQTLPFCYGDYVVYKGKSLFNVNESEIIESFQCLLNDLDTLTYAQYFCELIDIALPEGESSRELFKEFVTSMYMIKTNAFDLEILARAFEIKLLKLTGYGINFDDPYMKISAASRNILKYMDSVSIEKLYRVKLNNDVKSEIYKVLNFYISQNYKREPKSLQIYNIMKRSVKK